MTTQRPQNERHAGNGHDNRSSHEIEHDIERTRGEMDETLDELGRRMDPRNWVDEALDLFRGAAGGASSDDLAHQASRVGRGALRQVKRHPVPALLIGAGLAWLMFEPDEEEPDFHSQWADIPEHSGSFVDARTGEPYDDSYGSEWKQESPAWHAGYDWSKSDQDEQAWSERAKKSLEEIRQTLSSEQHSPGQKMKHAAAHVMGLSGHKQKEIHARWANLQEHSGSFVDCRTGEPYDDTYGQEWRNLVAADYGASQRWSEEEEQTWTEKANEAVRQVQEALSDTGRSVKEQTALVASKVGEFFSGTGHAATHYSRSIRDGAMSAAGSVRRGARRTAASARRGGARMQRQAQQGYAYSREQFGQAYAYSRNQACQAMDEQPLAVGAAFLGLGLLAGLALPRTRYEDEAMGETSDEVKRQAKETGRQAVRQAKEVGEATAAAALDEAERQGLTPQQIAERAQEAAAHVKQTVKEETRGASAHNVRDKVEQVAGRAVSEAKDQTKSRTQGQQAAAGQEQHR